MIKLSDTQLVVLSAACHRPDRNVLPLPATLKGGAQQKVVGSLLAKGLVQEGAACPEDAVWRTDEDGRKLALLATNAAFQALGIEVEAASNKEEANAPAQGHKRGDEPKSAPGVNRKMPKPPHRPARTRSRARSAPTPNRPSLLPCCSSRTAPAFMRSSPQLGGRPTPSVVQLRVR